MAKRVLEVGNCAADHAAVSDLLEKHFHVEVVQTHTYDDTLAALREGNYELVLINRQLDRDQTDGVELIRKIKSQRELSDVPIMLISNYPEYQQRAMELGATPGFGKAELTSPETRKKLQQLLG